jgi:acyl carrier protein phosphodiesterase
LVGNIISDFVKGRKKFDYSMGIQAGISLHRSIDSFTDDHVVVKEAKKVFREAYGLYSGPFVDILFDHFLAQDQSQFVNDSLAEFSAAVYNTLDVYSNVFPENFGFIFPFMKEHNWLYNYRFAWGIQRSFRGLVHRAAYISNSEIAFKLFESNYSLLKEYYSLFFPQLKEYAFNEFKRLLKELDA